MSGILILIFVLEKSSEIFLSHECHPSRLFREKFSSRTCPGHHRRLFRVQNNGNRVKNKLEVEHIFSDSTISVLNPVHFVLDLLGR